MKMKYIILLLAVTVFSNCLLAQDIAIKDTIYFDENDIKIDRIKGLKKCYSEIYYCVKYENDSLVKFKIMPEYFYDKMDSISHKQIINLLNSRMDIQVTIEKTLLISYRADIENYEGYLDRFNDTKNRLNDSRFSRLIPMTDKQFENKNKNFLKTQKKCIKKVNKIGNIFQFYVFTKNKGYLINEDSINWRKDFNNMFKDLFFKKGRLLILKPNGDYLITMNRLGDDFLFKHLETSNWDVLKTTWNKNQISLPKDKNKKSIYQRKTDKPFYLTCF